MSLGFLCKPYVIIYIADAIYPIYYRDIGICFPIRSLIFKSRITCSKLTIETLEQGVKYVNNEVKVNNKATRTTPLASKDAEYV